ncbi:hypothetical protein MP638_000190 [Amoeboaphelidium occidentale]|nr:hypothetical protein MP638_000190 [Amoeboaphelidium occidentale]
MFSSSPSQTKRRTPGQIRKLREVSPEHKEYMAHFDTFLQTNFDAQSVQQSIVTAFRSASMETRHDFLKMILLSSKNSDMSFVYNFVSKAPSLKIDFLSELPVELSVLILAHLADVEPRSLLRVALVSKKWKALLDNNDVWRQACAIKGWVPVKWNKVFSEPLNSATGQLVKRQKVFSNLLRSFLFAVPSFHKIKAPWKSVYIDHMLTERNWNSGNFVLRPIRRSSRDFETDEVNNAFCLSFDDNLESAVSTTTDGTSLGIVWKLKNGDVTSRLIGHQGPLSTVYVGKHVIVSGGVDAVLKVWDTAKGICLFTLEGHEGEINCIHCDEEHIYSGSQDKSLRVWSLTSGKCLKVIDNAHEEAVTCIDSNKTCIASASADGMIVVHSKHDYKSFKIAAHEESVYCMTIDDTCIISGGGDAVAKIFDVETGTLLRTLKGHKAAVVSIQSDKKRIVSASTDRSIKVWSYQSGALLYSIDHHKSPIWRIKFDDRRLISSSLDQDVVMFNFSGLGTLSEDQKRKFGVEDASHNDLIEIDE